MPSSNPAEVVFARGDGIGPEIMDATLEILEAAQARLVLHEVEIGQKVYERGIPTGIEDSTWDILRQTGVFLKAPITTPQGKGFASLNVTTRKTLGLYANVRPCRSYHPFSRSLHPGMNVVVIRENEEDTYAGIEHRQTREVTQCLKLISRPGSERIIRYAFDYAVRNGRKKLTCFSKDNIMKITDGLFHRVFDEVATEYPQIETEHIIVDIGAALVADSPEMFDVIVTENLYGDIISDITAQVAGSVGLAGSANVGDSCAMFEAIHGSAPPIAGKNVANPSGLLQGAVMMLVHLNQAEVAETIRNAWLSAIEAGVHTADIRVADDRHPVVGTKEFAQAVIDRLGEKPRSLRAVAFSKGVESRPASATKAEKKETVGIDVFLDWDESGRDPQVLGKKLEAVSGEGLRMSMITNRGVKVYPDGLPETFCTDHWRARFHADTKDGTVSHAQLLALLGRIHAAGLDFIKTEHLCTFDGEPGYSRGQGE